MPRFDYKIGMEDGIHLYSYIGRDRDDGSQVEDPAEEVQGAREETNDTAITRTRGNGSPVIDTSSRRYSRCQLLVRVVSRGKKMSRYERVKYLRNRRSDKSVI